MGTGVRGWGEGEVKDGQENLSGTHPFVLATRRMEQERLFEVCATLWERLWFVSVSYNLNNHGQLRPIVPGLVVTRVVRKESVIFHAEVLIKGTEFDLLQSCLPRP